MPRNVRMPRPYLHGYDPAPTREPEDASKAMSPSGAWASGGTRPTERAVYSHRIFSPGAGEPPSPAWPRNGNQGRLICPGEAP